MVDCVPFCILLIEDNRDTQANVRDILESPDYQVLIASNFAEAFQHQDWATIGAILTDRKLLDGLAEDMLPLLKHAAPQVPVVVLTGFPDVQGSIAALRQGAYDYMLALKREHVSSP